jgi:uncharacterized protein YjbI with pentapeptide repeats
MTRKDDIQKLVQHYQRRLQKLNEQQARQGIQTPPAILTEIEDIEAEIDKLLIELETLGSTAQPSIEELSPRDRQYQIALHWAEDGRQASLARFDLSGRDLRTCDLVGAKLNVANLSGADLSLANLGFV